MSSDAERHLIASLEQSPEPDRQFAETLLDRLTGEIFGASAGRSVNADSGSTKEGSLMIASLDRVVVTPLRAKENLNGHVGGFPTARSREVRPALAIAAVLALLLSGALFLFQWLGHNREPVRVIPAAIVTENELPGADATVTTLFSATIRPEDFPLDKLTEWNKSLISLMEMEPGVTYNTDHPAFFCCEGLAILSIVDGQLSIESEGEVMIYRAGNGNLMPERVDSGETATGSSGDTIVHRMAVPTDVTNTANHLTTFLAGYVYNHASPPPPGACCWPEGYFESEVAWTQTFTPEVATSGPVNVSWERITFDPAEDSVINTSISQVILSATRDGEFGLKFITDDGTINDFSTRISGPRASSLDAFNSDSIGVVSESEEPTELYVFRFDPLVTDA